MMIPLMYEDPFYDLNYVYAAVLALQYYEMLENDPERFRKGYVALLKNGFDAPPQDLLKKFLAIDMEDPTMVDRALTLVGSRVEQLRTSYQKTSLLPGRPDRNKRLGGVLGSSPQIHSSCTKSVHFALKHGPFPGGKFRVETVQ
jgi:hypothetical protein